MSLGTTIETAGCHAYREKYAHALQLLRARQHRQANTTLQSLLKHNDIIGEQRAHMLASLLVSLRSNPVYDRDQYTCRLRELSACLRSFKVPPHSIFHHLRSSPCFFNCIGAIEYDLMRVGLY